MMSLERRRRQTAPPCHRFVGYDWPVPKPGKQEESNHKPTRVRAILATSQKKGGAPWGAQNSFQHKKSLCAQAVAGLVSAQLSA